MLRSLLKLYGNIKDKFVRQYVIEPYIVDFVCRKKKLIIELDGNQHVEAKEYDEERTIYLEAQGYKVLRFWNNEVLNNIDDIKARISFALNGSGMDSRSELIPLYRSVSRSD